ncbi:50S ribosomal protein L22 [uncultured archaeon]|nr:50S ribosomal protein L22 [uncultured archaeon]
MTYAYQSIPNERTAMARVDGVNASYKDLANVCSNVRGRNAEKALEFLNEAARGDRPIRLYKFNKHRGHVGRIGGVKGGWPVKSCKIVRDVLANAIANAESKGMGACKIAHIQANKKLVYGRMSAKGRRTRQDLETAFVEIVLKEIAGQEKKAEEKKMENKSVSTPKAETKPSTPAPKTEEKKSEVKPSSGAPAKPVAAPAQAKS